MVFCMVLCMVSMRAKWLIIDQPYHDVVHGVAHGVLHGVVDGGHEGKVVDQPYHGVVHHLQVNHGLQAALK